jgi:NADH pyrophosphatase NudC (nudix superfamily)
MAKYIECEAAKRAIMSQYLSRANKTKYADVIDAVPAADVVPVRHERFGKMDCFTVGNKRYTAYQCSACSALYPNVDGFQFCPNCGAKMDKDGDGDV